MSKQEQRPGEGESPKIDINQYSPTNPNEVVWLDSSEFPPLTIAQIPEEEHVLWRDHINSHQTMIVVNVLHRDFPDSPFQVQVFFGNGLKGYFIIRLEVENKEVIPFELTERITGNTVIPALTDKYAELFEW